MSVKIVLDLELTLAFMIPRYTEMRVIWTPRYTDFRLQGFLCFAKCYRRELPCTIQLAKSQKKTGIPISTLRYYDQEGMFPQIGRGNGGIRSFSDQEAEVLEVIECLKSSGLSIKDIKQFFDWCGEGDASLKKRRDLFCRLLEAMNATLQKYKRLLI